MRANFFLVHFVRLPFSVYFFQLMASLLLVFLYINDQHQAYNHHFHEKVHVRFLCDFVSRGMLAGFLFVSYRFFCFVHYRAKSICLTVTVSYSSLLLFESVSIMSLFSECIVLFAVSRHEN